MVLFTDRPPQQRTQEIQAHPATVRKLTRRFQRQGMLGLLPDDIEVADKGQGREGERWSYFQ